MALQRMITEIERDMSDLSAYIKHEQMRRKLAEQAERQEMDRLASELGIAILWSRYQLNKGDYAVFRYVYSDVLVRVGKIIRAKCYDQYGALYLDVVPAHREDRGVPMSISLTIAKDSKSLSPQDDTYTAQIIPARYVSANVIEQMPEVHREAYAKHIYGAK